MSKRTTAFQLSFEQFDHRLRMSLALLIAFDYFAELGHPFVEWDKVALVVHPRFVHVIQDLLHDA